jgi:ectoine hydroxylase-related dioxygenase (phytanoyl-CoA dioxygenase family)
VRVGASGDALVARVGNVASVIDESLVDTFEAQGAVAVRGLLDAEWIRTLRDAMPEILERTYDPVEKMGDGEGRTTRGRDGMWRDCEPFARFLFDSPVGAAAAAFMRSTTARLYEDLLLYQDPGGDGPAGWHRDAPYWPLSGQQLSSIWFSLESVTRDTGGMRFVTASHLDDDELVRAASVPSAEAEQRPVVVIEAEPGDVVVFHPRALHTAYGSAPDRPRRTFTLRFTGDDIRWRPRRAMYHEWMRQCGLHKGDVLDHPWFPVVGRSPGPG